MHALLWIAVAVVILALSAWLGVRLGGKVARRYPAAAGALWLIMSFIKLDPPPPPKAERITRSEDEAGDPPQT